MATKPTASLVNQKIDDHVGACADRYEAIDRRLYRIEAIMIGASADSVAMVEGEFDEVSEQCMADAIRFGHEAIKKQIEAQVRLVAAVGKKETRTYEEENHDEAVEKKVHAFSYQTCYDIAKQGLSKKDRGEKFSESHE